MNRFRTRDQQTHLRPARSRRSRGSGIAIAISLSLVVGAVATATMPREARAATVGAGSYTTSLPAGAKLPTGCGDIATNPRAYVTKNAPKGPIPTNDWWSSIIFKKTDCAFGEPMFAHPAAYDTYPGGLGISYATTPTITGTAGGVGEYKFSYTRDVLVGVDGMNAGTVAVDGWSDWTVTPSWTDGSKSLTATIGHGLPLSYYQVKGGDAKITTDGGSIWSNSGSTVGFSVRGHDYVAYAPTGSSWKNTGGVLTSSLGGKGYFSVAVLPTTSKSTDTQRKNLASSYGTYAYAFVTGTKVSYSYNAATAKVNTTYAFTTSKKEGSETKTIAALYPHQSNALTGATPIAASYVSPRGAMKTLVGISSFRTSMTYQGVLPEVPAVATGKGADLATLKGYLAQAAADPEGGQQFADTYWSGKGLGRAARIAEIADQVGDTATRDTALAAMKKTLNNWFTAAPGEAGQLFYYDKNWGTLIGYPASYGSDQELNDHHFHYGYFIAAAATLAKFDPNWAKNTQYGGMVDLLIRDANNFDRSDTRFPFLRDFDIYAGHDWASGHGSFASGNNQESSSEGMNFDGALIQWGQATGNTAVRDAGIYMYTTQAAAIADYWFDVDNKNFPANFPHSAVGMVWGDGGAYATWFSADPEKIQGINQLPVTGNHLYLGDHPAYNEKNYAEMVKNSGGEPKYWQDILWEFLALGNGEKSLAKFKANPGYLPEEGESRAHTYHWIDNLAALGNVDTSVTANYPISAVFTKAGKKTYVASNLSNTPVTVSFSDGKKLTVAAGKTATTGAFSWTGGGAKGGTAPTNPPTTPTSPPTTPTAPPPTTTPTAPPTTPTAPPTTPTTTPTTPPTSPPTSPPPASGSTVRYLLTGGTTGSKGSAGTVSITPADGEHQDTPNHAASFTSTGLTLAYRGGQTAFDLAVDAKSVVGNGVQVRVSYDLTGNGSVDRVETYRYFATDPVDGYEHYSAAAGLSSATGALGDLKGGTVKIEVWNAIGHGATTLGIGDTSQVTLPFG
ncbi:MAG: glycosyl hydrolase [Propionibacteriaceae bacterium]